MVAARESNGIRRGDVFLVKLGPARGSEIKKARPCVVVSPDELNQHLSTFIVAPMTTGRHAYPFRVSCRFRGKAGHVVIDQIRAVDRARMMRRIGRLAPQSLARVLGNLQTMFAP